jgi:hypothetical protein
MRPGDLELIRGSKLVGFTLVDLDADPGELHDVAAEHPDLTARLTAQAQRIFGDIQADVKPWKESWLSRW